MHGLGGDLMLNPVKTKFRRTKGACAVLRLIQCGRPGPLSKGLGRTALGEVFETRINVEISEMYGVAKVSEFS